MSGNALESQGTLIKLGDGASPEVFTTIAEIKDFGGPTGTAAIIDVSDLNSTAREKRTGLIDNGQLSFNAHYIPANVQHAALKTAFDARTSKNIKLLFTDSPTTTWDFAAYVSGFQVSGEVDGVNMVAVTLEITGAITET